MASRPADFKSDASTGFATQACGEAYREGAGGRCLRMRDLALVGADLAATPSRESVAAKSAPTKAEDWLTSSTDLKPGLLPQKKPRRSGAFDLEAEVGIEPAYADLQSAA